jgi:hypothetical protein
VSPAGQYEAWIADIKPPRLAIRRDGGNVTVSWETNAPGFALEQTESLSASRTWNTNAAPVSITGHQCVVTPYLTSSPCFFRLRKP